MLLAMGMTAALCVCIGIWPEPLYALLPFGVSYAPYTISHSITQLQLLLFAALVFIVLTRAGLYPLARKSIIVDFDWVYRRFLPRVIGHLGRAIDIIFEGVTDNAKSVIRAAVSSSATVFAPGGLSGRINSVGNAVAIVAFFSWSH